MNTTIIKTPKYINIKPEVRFGKPVILGTRIAVADILGLIESGYALREIPDQYPTITLDKARMAVRYATNILGKEEILSLSA